MRGLVFILFMVSMMPLSLIEPFVGLLIWILLSDMNPYREVWGIASEIRWVFLFAILTVISMFLHPSNVRKIEWSALSVTMLLFVIWTIITTHFAVVPGYATVHRTQLLKVMGLSFAIIMLVNNPTRVRWIVWTFVVSFGIWSAKGGFFTLIHGGSYRVYGPTGSFFTDNNQFALVMCMVLPFMRYLQVHAESPWIRRGLWVLMGLTVVSILGTYSRGGQVALGVVLMMMILKSRRRVGMILGVVIILPLALNTLPEKWVHRMDGLTSGAAVQSNSFQGRVDSWEFATNVALHYPILGGGFGVWASQEMWDIYGPHRLKQGKAIHSIWFEVLAEQGFVGLGLYVAAFAFAWLDLARIRRRTGGHLERLWLYDLCGYSQVALIGFVVAGSALPQAYFNFTFQIFALVVCVRKLSEQNAVVVEQPRNAIAGKVQWLRF